MDIAAQHEAIARHWFAAFNTHQLEELLALYHDEAQHYSPKLKLRQPETEGLITGKEALRTWWKDAFERLPDLHYRATSLTADSKRVFMEYLREVPGEAVLKVAEVLEIEEGKLWPPGYIMDKTSPPA